MAGRDIAHGEISIGVDLDRVGAELRAAEAQFQRTMANIDRMKAEAEVGLDTSELDRRIAYVKAKIRELESLDPEVEVDIDKKQLEKDLAELKAQLADLNQDKVEIKVRADELKNAKKLAEDLERRQDASNKRLSEYAKIQRGIIADQRKLAVEHQKALDMDRRRTAQMQSEFMQMQRWHQQALDMEERRLEVARQAAITQQRAITEDRRRFDQEMESEGRLQMIARQRETAEARAAEAEQAAMRTRLGQQQQAIDMDRRRTVEVEDLRLKYIKLHDEFERGQKFELFDFLGDEGARARFGKTVAELEKARARLKELGESDDDLRRLAKASDNAGSRLRTMMSSLGSVRLQMGFFSATLRQTATGFTILGPIIFALAGQIASLIGVLGTGLTGALAVGVAGLAGFGTTALGIGLIMKPLIGDLQDAMKASNSYGDAVRKYGKGSEQAATAQDKLNKTLGDVGPKTKAAFQSLGSISDRWGKLTSSARPMFFDAMATGITAVNRLMPTFARESVKAFGTGSREAKKWFNLVSSPAAASGLQQIMSNFTSAVPDLSAGFRSIASMLGRISLSASKMLPSLTSGFKTWANNLEDSVGGGDKLDSNLNRLVNHMRQIGHFAQSAGRMLAAFFNAGANEGASLLGTLTNIFNRWTSWMNSASGQDSLAQFFSEANSIGSQFVGTLAQLGVALFEFSSAFAPLSQGAVAFLNAITKVVAAVMGLKGAQTVVTALGGALAGAFVASKFMAAASAIGAIVTALRTLSAGSMVMSIASMTNPIIGIAAIVGGAVAALSLLGGSADKVASSLNATAAAARGVKEAISSMAGNDINAAQAGLELSAATEAKKAAQEGYNKAVDKFGKKSPQAAAAERALTEATVRRQSAVVNMNAAIKQSGDNYEQAYKKASNAIDTASESLATNRQRIKDWKSEVEDQGMDWSDDMQKNRSSIQAATAEGDEYVQALKDINAEKKRLAKNTALVEKLNNRQALSDLNTARAQKGLSGTLQNVGKAWRDIRTSLGYLDNGQKIDRTFESMQAKPKQLSSMIQLTNSLDKMGKLKDAGKIIVNAKGVDEALAKLRKLNKTSKTLVEADVKTDKANREIQSLGKGKTATINAKADTRQARQQMSQLSGKQLAARITIRGNNADAMSKLTQVQRVRLKEKLLRMNASPAAVLAAISIINNKKIPEKLAKFKADSSDAESADRKVQGFRDKTVRVNTTADLSGAQAAQSAINSIPNTSYKDVITRYSSQGTPGRASGGPVVGSRATTRAEDRRNANTADQANTRRNRPGLYKRPTLLVGEERQDEWVIASNPAYRSANEAFLSDAAANFGYRLEPIEMARKGKNPAAAYAKRRTGYVKYNKKAELGGYSYDFITAKIDELSNMSSNRETERNADLDRGVPAKKARPGLEAVLNPLQAIRDKWYDQLAYNLRKRANAAAKSATKNRRQIPKLSKQIKAAANRVKEIRGRKPDSDKDRRDKENDLTKAQNALQKLRDQRSKAKQLFGSRGDTAGSLWRELQGLTQDRYALKNRIQAIKDSEKSRQEQSSGGSDSTPMGVQLGQLDKSRYDVWQQFAGNMVSPGSIPGSALPGGPTGSTGSSAGPVGATPPSSPSFYSSPAASGAFPSVGAAASGGSGSGGGNTTTVNLTNHFTEPPPDPHSFSKQLGWEAGSLLG